LVSTFDDIPVYYGFAWTASDKAAEWIFANRWSDDGINLRPPDIFLPSPGMTEYQSICVFGKQADPNNFVNHVSQQRRVKFGNYTYYYRKVEPSESDYPIGIVIDRTPKEYLQSGDRVLTFKNWTKTITRTFLNFKQFSLNNLIGGGVDEGSFVTQLSCFGKPDLYVDGSLYYFDLGLAFLLSANYRIAYIFIYFQPVNSFDDRSTHFSVFSGDLLYDKKLIDLSELQNCDALIQSFNDSRFKLYDTNTYIINGTRKDTNAYIEEINGTRKRTVVFEYKNDCINTIILY
jgi:hypothetical protein